MRCGALAQLGAHNTGSVGVRGSNPLCSTNKNRTFVYRQMFCYCLSKPQAWYIISPLGLDIINNGKPLLDIITP